MIRNYFKTAFRGLLKNKGITIINVLGLALGLAICLLIVFYVVDELSYDKYNVNYERIYRVNTDLKYNGVETHFAISAQPVAEALVKEFPQVEQAAGIAPAVNIRFKKGNDVIREDGATYYCDATIFSVFTLPMIVGDAKTALKEPNSIVITESEAKKYFNKTNAVGETLFSVTDSTLRKVTGVVRDMPAQSHFRADFFLSCGENRKNNWNGFSVNTYVLLMPGTNARHAENGFNALMKKRLNTPGFNYTKFEKSGNYIRLGLMPLKDIHLQSNRQSELAPNGNIQYVYVFSAVAIFILLLACINFINLSTARSANRAREVGVRKVLGSSRRILIVQFLMESLIVTAAAAIIAVIIAWILLPFFNQISGKQLSISWQTMRWLTPSLLVLVFIVGIVAGSYPAFLLSAFKPVDVLKGKLSAGFKGSALRSTLVVIQFGVAVFLIIGTLVIYNQLSYIQNKDLGFKRSQVLTIKNVTVLQNPLTLKQEIKQLPGVTDATLTSFLPTGGSKWLNSVANDKNGMLTQFWTIDEDYLNTMGMTLKNGRSFSAQIASDSSGMIINETAAKMFGLPDNPIDKTLTTGQAENEKRYHIVGVVKDFNFSSLRDNITPLVMTMGHDWRASLSVRLSTDNLPALLHKIEANWKTLAPNEHFEYSFMDEDFDALYRTEQRMGTLFIVFASLAILIACLGLFGLAAYAAGQRVREIGIRKVLGASATGLVTLLAKDFIKLVFISIIIATPLAWLIMQKWLQGFAYREGIHWWVFIATGFGAIIIAFVTVSFQSVKAAMANPVESLRAE